MLSPHLYACGDTERYDYKPNQNKDNGNQDCNWGQKHEIEHERLIKRGYCSMCFTVMSSTLIERSFLSLIGLYTGLYCLWAYDHCYKKSFQLLALHF